MLGVVINRLDIKLQVHLVGSELFSILSNHTRNSLIKLAVGVISTALYMRAVSLSGDALQSELFTGNLDKSFNTQLQCNDLQCLGKELSENGSRSTMYYHLVLSFLIS